MRILAFPYRGIAYNDSFYVAVEQLCTTVIEGIFSGGWIKDNVKKDDIVHIHWPSFFYAATGTNLEVLLSFIRFLALLLYIHLKSAGIVWTAHNLYPHDKNKLPALDNIARKVMVRLSKKIFVHSKEAEAILIKEFMASKGKTVIIPHGNWIAKYGNTSSITKHQARKLLNLPNEGFVYLLFGQMKPYKNLDGLIKAFCAEAGSNDRLLVAGKFSSNEYYDSIKTLANADRRICIHSEFIPDEKVINFLKASDVMCIPYREILTSGTAMLAMSYGLPVISVDRGFLKDVIKPISGLLIPQGSDEKLASALRKVKEVNWCSEEIIKSAERFTFEEAAKIFISTTTMTKTQG